MSTIFADQETGEIQDVKGGAVMGAQRLVEAIWRETADSYDLAPLTALAVAQKITTAVLGGAVAEHAKILAEPYMPRQKRLEGME